jgi:hypothetical protein
MSDTPILSNAAIQPHKKFIVGELNEALAELSPQGLLGAAYLVCATFPADSPAAASLRTGLTVRGIYVPTNESVKSVWEDPNYVPFSYE